MKKEYVIENVLTGLGPLNAMLKNVMSQMEIEDPNEAIRRINAGEWIVKCPDRQWELRDGLIYFSVTSDGTIGKDWITRLKKQGRRVGSYAESILLSSDFCPTKGITYRIAVVPGKLFTSDPTTAEIRHDLDQRGIKHGKSITAEIACLIREKFTDEDLKAMGLEWIVVMHEPIKDSGGNPDLLGADRFDDGSWLRADFDYPSGRWDRGGGFAGVVSQVSAQA